jgi:hypothetical protein
MLTLHLCLKYVHTKLHLPDSTASLVTAIKQEDKQNTLWAATNLLLYTLQRNSSYKICRFMEDTIQNCMFLLWPLTNIYHLHVGVTDSRNLKSEKVEWSLLAWCLYQVSYKSTSWFNVIWGKHGHAAMLILQTTLHCHDFSDYRRVLDWWPDFLNSFIQRLTTLYSTLLQAQTHTSVRSHVFTVVAWQRLPKADIHLPLGSQTIPGLS